MLRASHAVTAVMVNEEARRRIEAVYRPHDQTNMLLWGADNQVAEMRGFISSIIDRARALKALPQIPHDFRHDRHWE